MKVRGGEFSTGTMGNFQPELTAVTRNEQSQKLHAPNPRMGHPAPRFPES